MLLSHFILLPSEVGNIWVKLQDVVLGHFTFLLKWSKDSAWVVLSWAPNINCSSLLWCPQGLSLNTSPLRKTTKKQPHSLPTKALQFLLQTEDGTQPTYLPHQEMRPFPKPSALPYAPSPCSHLIFLVSLPSQEHCWNAACHHCLSALHTILLLDSLPLPQSSEWKCTQPSSCLRWLMAL